MSARRRSAAWRGITGVLLTAGILTALAGCGWRGLNSMQLPGTAGGGPGAYTIQAQLPDVSESGAELPGAGG